MDTVKHHSSIKLFLGFQSLGKTPLNDEFLLRGLLDIIDGICTDHF